MTSILHRSPRRVYPMANRSEGLRIFDEKGRSWLDMSGGAAVTMVGHQHPQVVEAIKKQTELLSFAHTAFFTNQPHELLAEKLVHRFGDTAARAYLTSSGSEANETALKLAWQYWAAVGRPEKKKIISREHSYHGNTLGALSVSGNISRRKACAAPLLDWPRVSPCYAYRLKAEEMSEADYTASLIQELAETFESNDPETIAAFICEPIVGASLGVVAATKGYLAEIRKLCDQYDILLILDEVMCGSGRTGSYFAHKKFGVSPDIVTLAKGIAGGYVPLSATIINGRIAQVMEEATFRHGHTYVGHPVACAAGLAVQNVLDDEKLLEHATQTSPSLHQILNTALADHENVGDIRGTGYFYGIEFVADKNTKAGFDGGSHLASKLMSTAMDNGLICYPGSVKFDEKTVPHILLAPPLIAREDDFRELAQKLKVIIDKVFHG